MVLTELSPVVGNITRLIPGRFPLADHQFALAPRRISIRHEIMNDQVPPTPEISTINLSYSSSGALWRTDVDVPLFYSDVFGLSDWAAYPFGNYTMSFDRDVFGNERIIYIQARTRF